MVFDVTKIVGRRLLQDYWLSITVTGPITLSLHYPLWYISLYLGVVLKDGGCPDRNTWQAQVLNWNALIILNAFRRCSNTGAYWTNLTNVQGWLSLTNAFRLVYHELLRNENETSIPTYSIMYIQEQLDITSWIWTNVYQRKSNYILSQSNCDCKSLRRYKILFQWCLRLPEARSDDCSFGWSRILQNRLSVTRS